jgi:tetratricopeptide (TPR) repeat protein
VTGHRRGRPAAVLLVCSIALSAAAPACSADGPSGERKQADEVLQQGLRAHANGDLEAAEEAYLLVIQLDPQNKFAYYNLGVINQSRDEADLAVRNYRTTLRIDPDFVPALFNLAILRTESGAAAEAEGLYEHIIEVDPSHELVAATHLNLGFLLIEQGRERRGRRELEEAVRLDPSLEDRIGPETSVEPPASEGGGG